MINGWFGTFYNLIQQALSKPNSITQGQFYAQQATFLGIAMTYIASAVLTAFITSHYIFRWRQAMNDYYAANWQRLRQVEGASQRVQEDTMKFAETLEGPRHSPDRRGDVPDRLPAHPVGALYLREGAAARRLCPPGAGCRGHPLGGVRHRPAGPRRHTATGARVPQPKSRGGLSQGTGAWRGQYRPSPAADPCNPVPRRAGQLLPPLPELPLLQHRPLRIPASRRVVAYCALGPTIVAAASPWVSCSRLSAPSARSSLPSNIWSTRGRRS